MANWRTTVRIKHLLTEREDHQAVQESMTAIANALSRTEYFLLFDLAPFHNIPEGDDVFGPVDYANKLMGRMYDFADQWRIWLG